MSLQTADNFRSCADLSFENTGFTISMQTFNIDFLPVESFIALTADWTAESLANYVLARDVIFHPPLPHR